ncbi:MAG: hypothetical protein PHO96_02855 [Candidatus Izemoplasmatales bacterium]|nr:hypothetical protein [Candidatus Izemoplasmatales bacterium]
MRVLSYKRTLLLMLGLFAALSFWGCSGKTTTADVIVETDAIIPALSFPNEVFFDGGEYQVTYQDLYKKMKIDDGLTQLLTMVDSIFLSEYIAQVTEDEITKKIEYMKFGTNDPDVISHLSAEEIAKYEQSYTDNMFLKGYQGNEEALVRLTVAKENYCIDQMKLAQNSDKTWYVGPSTIAKYYDNSTMPDLHTLRIRFMSEIDSKEVMKSLNLVGLSGNLYRYTGTKPIGDVPSNGFNDTNTVALDADEILESFIQMYNIVYGSYRDPISTEATVQDLLELPDLRVSYQDTLTINATLNFFMYGTLGTREAYLDGDDEKAYYTYIPVKYFTNRDTAYYMILNLKKADKETVGTFTGTEAELRALIGDDVYDAIEDALILKNFNTSGFTTTRLAEMRKSHDFVIYDYYLGIDYQQLDTAYELDEEGHATYVAKYDDVSITADELFMYAFERNPALYLIYAAQMPLLIANHFADVYCESGETCELDFSKNNSDKMKLHRTALANMKKQFEEDYLSYYYTFEEYIYLAYGATSEADMLDLHFVKTVLQPFAIFDLLKRDQWHLLEDYLDVLADEYYDNYFSLNVTHLLIAIDRNEDGSPDNYDRFLENLEDREEYDLLLEDFQTEILAYMNESTENTYAKLIQVYTRAKRNDPRWGQFKNYGFFLIQENLSSSASLSYAKDKDTYHKDFVNAMIAGYQAYKLPANVDKQSFLYETFIDTSFGSHLLLLSKGSAFDVVSAKFTMTYENSGIPKFTVGTENTEDRLSLEQMKIYAEYRFLTMVYGTDEAFLESMSITLPKIPTSVTNAINMFYSDLHDSVYVAGSLNLIVIERLLEGTLTNAHGDYISLTSTDLNTMLDDFYEYYFRTVFPRYDEFVA